MSTGEHILVCEAAERGRQYVSRISPAGISVSEQLDDGFRVVGWCNGLLCLKLSDKENCKFVLLNPTTFELKYLPPFGIENSSCGESSCCSRKCSISFELKYQTPKCALGFDSRNGDFKLLVLVETCYYDLDHQYEDDDENKDPDASRHCISVKIFIYSLKTNTWKERKELACPWEWRWTMGMATSFKSVCYWAVNECIGSFNFCDEKFSSMPYPSDIFDRSLVDYVIIDLLGSVGVVTYLRFGGSRFFRFWVWEDEDEDEDGGWKRKTDYDVFLFGVCKPLGFSHFGPSCWFLGLDGMLVQYDYATKETKNLYQFCDSTMKLFPHVVNNLNLNGTSVICDVLNKLNL